MTQTKADVMEDLIEYMHRGEIDDFKPIVMDLFKLSHKYDFHPLHVN
jgi:hypothetical protein